MTDEKNEIAELRAELAKVKAAQAALAPTVSDSADMARWADEMHQLAERRASHAYTPSREELAAYEQACPPAACRDIVSKGTVQPPSMAGAAGQITAVSRSPGLHGTTGWAPQVPFTRNDLHPTPGVAAADRLMDQADAQDRIELAKRIAEQQVAQAAAKGSKGP